MTLTGNEIRSSFCISELTTWKEDPKNKGQIEAIDNRIDVLMTMDFRKAIKDGKIKHRESLTEKEERELELFEEQFRQRNNNRKN